MLYGVSNSINTFIITAWDTHFANEYKFDIYSYKTRNTIRLSAPVITGNDRYQVIECTLPVLDVGEYEYTVVLLDGQDEIIVEKGVLKIV